MKIAWALLCVSILPALPQPPGQRFPGQEPDERPRMRRQPDSRRAKQQVVLTTTSGMLRRYAGRQFVIEADDHRIVWYRITGETTFQKDGAPSKATDWQPGDRVSVDSTPDEQDNFVASAVRFDKPGTPADRAISLRQWDLPPLEPGVIAPPLPPAAGESERVRGNEPSPAAAPELEAPPVKVTTVKPADAPPDPDDPGPPVLRRGIPAARKRPSTPEAEPPPVPAAATAQNPEAPAPAPQPEEPEEDPLLTKARAEAASYASSLPNFFCKQTTTRYQSDNPKRGWDALDVITADLAYEDGKESYKNIQVGGKPAKGGMMDVGGASSTGEFQTVLDEVLSPGRATFRRAGSDTVSGRAAVMFKYEVPRELSRWRIQASSQLYYPGYRGTIWIDRETTRVVRLEMQGRSLPVDFPFDTVETAVDYSLVRLTPTNSFLLPVSAELLSCQRGTRYCSRNRIEFRNYRKFGSESNITYEDKP